MGLINYPPNNTTMTSVNTPQLGDPCRSCRKRKSTGWWTDAGALGLTHGFAAPWCQVCMAKAQLKYARDCVKRIPELERALRRAHRQAKAIDK